MTIRPEIEGKNGLGSTGRAGWTPALLRNLADWGCVMWLDLGGNIQYLQAQWRGIVPGGMFAEKIKKAVTACIMP